MSNCWVILFVFLVGCAKGEMTCYDPTGNVTFKGHVTEAELNKDGVRFTDAYGQRHATTNRCDFIKDDK